MGPTIWALWGPLNGPFCDPLLGLANDQFFHDFWTTSSHCFLGLLTAAAISIVAVLVAAAESAAPIVGVSSQIRGKLAIVTVLAVEVSAVVPVKAA